MCEVQCAGASVPSFVYDTSPVADVLSIVRSLDARTHANAPAHTHTRTMLSRRRSSRWAPSPSLPCIALSRRRSSRWAPSPSSRSCSPPAPPRFRCALPRRRATARPRWFQGIRFFRLCHGDMRCVHGTEHVLCGPSTYPVTGTALRAWTGSIFGAFSAVPATGTAEKVSLALRARMQSAHRFRCWCFGITCASDPGAHRLRCF